MSSAGTAVAASPVEQAVLTALAAVNDPEIRRPITDLGMVESVLVEEGVAQIRILLTIAGCPLRDKLTSDITAAATTVMGVDSVSIDFGVMSDDQRKSLQVTL